MGSGTTTIRHPVPEPVGVAEVKDAGPDLSSAAGSGSIQFAPCGPLILVLLVAACYSYTPLESPAPASGTRVAADLTDAGSLQLASQIGPGATRVRGEVVESQPDALFLALTSVLGRNEQETFWSGEQVRIPLITVARVQQRSFALGKTILFGGAVLGGLFAAIKAFEGSGNGGGTTGGPGEPSPQ
jgi:hypothetical protein